MQWAKEEMVYEFEMPSYYVYIQPMVSAKQFSATINTSKIAHGTLIAKITNNSGEVTQLELAKGSASQTFSYNADCKIELLAQVTENDFAINGGVKYCQVTVADQSQKVDSQDQKTVSWDKGEFIYQNNVTLTPSISYEKWYVYRVGYGLNPDLVSTYNSNVASGSYDVTATDFNISTSNIHIRVAGRSAMMNNNIILKENISLYPYLNVIRNNATGVAGGFYTDQYGDRQGSTCYVSVKLAETELIVVMYFNEPGRDQKSTNMGTTTFKAATGGRTGNLNIYGFCVGTSSHIYAETNTNVGDIWLSME